MRLALLSNVTIELVAELFRPADEVWTPAGFGAWRQVCLEPPPELRAFAPDLIALVIDPADPSVSDADCASYCAALRQRLPGVVLVRLDLEDLAAEVGPAFFDERIRQLAGCPWSLVGQRAIADEIRRLAALRHSSPKKVLAVDFDGILWRGTLAEDGPQGIVHATDFQRALLALKRRGVLLVGLTKNDADEVARVWTLPQMVLKEEDFVAIRANWNPKPENLASVARTLNLGTDAFVFLDDNPGECAEMSAARPEVATVLVTGNQVSAVRRIARIHFPDFGPTDEDCMRTAAYRADAGRREAAEGRTLDDYLASLGTVVDFHPARADEAPRLAQLSLRCNQFNVRTSRYDEAEIRRMLDDPARLVFSVAVRDRFGDLGLVALLVLSRTGDTAQLDEWAMSCRAMNRRIEDETWTRLVALLRGRGIVRLEAEVRPTEKNGPVRGLFERLPTYS